MHSLFQDLGIFFVNLNISQSLLFQKKNVRSHLACFQKSCKQLVEWYQLSPYGGRGGVGGRTPLWNRRGPDARRKFFIQPLKKIEFWSRELAHRSS